MTAKRQEAKLKIYSSMGDFIGSAVYAEDAAALVAIQHDGATIRYGHSEKNIVWTEGEEDQGSASGLGYDAVAEIVYSRIASIPVRTTPGKG